LLEKKTEGKMNQMEIGHNKHWVKKKRRKTPGPEPRREA